MHPREVRMSVAVAPDEGRPLVESLHLGPECEVMAGHLLAETLMFRALKGVVESYLHVSQETVIHAWADASRPWSLGVVAAQPDERRFYRVEATVTAGEQPVLTQTAVLRAGQATARRAGPPQNEHRQTGAAAAADAVTDAEETWCPDPADVAQYSAWSHPNIHTDPDFARRTGFPRPLVQGLMMQNRVLGRVLAGSQVGLPLQVRTVFRRPALVATPLRIAYRRTPASVDAEITDVESGAVVCEVSVASCEAGR